MSSSDVRGLNGVGARSVGGSLLILSHLSLRCLIAVEVSDPESNDSSGVGALARLCASANLLIKSSSRCNLSTSSLLSCGMGQRSRSSSNMSFVDNWPSRRESVWALTASNTSRMRFKASRSMPGLTVALETTDGV